MLQLLLIVVFCEMCQPCSLWALPAGQATSEEGGGGGSGFGQPE